MVKMYKFFASIFSVGIMAVLGLSLYMQYTLPDNFYVASGEDFFINSQFSITTGVSKSTPIGKSYSADLRMLGGVGIKKVQVQVVERKLVVPGGTPFGIKMFTEGVMVVGMNDIKSGDELVNPAKKAGIKMGDIILKINGREVHSNEDTSKMFRESGGKPIIVEIKRQENKFTINMTPALSDNNGYMAGVWVRDSSAGIGTMTFFDPQNLSFAGLGHAVCDVDTGEIMPLLQGEIVDVNITGIKRGESGNPGELRGTFVGDTAMGRLEINSPSGVFGTLSAPILSNQAIPIGLKHEVKPGKATILSTISGNKPEEFNVIIEKVNISDAQSNKNMVIKIIDERLISKTGGIIQGMSGSPIIQDGKLIGAVTHVFVNEPTQGYGIFVENMDIVERNNENVLKKVS